jgi:carbon monoxide dehydrogenase subunit G
LKTSCSRSIAAARSDVWEVISNPYHLARWWPKVARVEAVQERTRGTGTLWTKVLQTQAGRQVRADFRCLYSKAPSSYGWEQEIEGSPFAKVLRSSEVGIDLDDSNGGTMVTLRASQRLRGISRFGGGFMLKRATNRQLEEALDGLERALTPGEPEGGSDD